MDQDQAEPAKARNLGDQRKLTVTITTPEPTSLYSNIELALFSVRIPDDLDDATVDQIIAKVAETFVRSVDHAIAASGRAQVMGALSEVAQAVRQGIIVTREDRIDVDVSEDETPGEAAGRELRRRALAGTEADEPVGVSG